MMSFWIIWMGSMVLEHLFIWRYFPIFILCKKLLRSAKLLGMLHLQIHSNPYLEQNHWKQIIYTISFACLFREEVIFITVTSSIHKLLAFISISFIIPSCQQSCTSSMIEWTVAFIRFAFTVGRAMGTTISAFRACD